MAKSTYATNVFVNCPFDDRFVDLHRAIIFAIFDCGYRPRCALEENNGADIRIEKINRIIAECKFGVHDISRTDLDDHNQLPRFNMPLELGIFLGARNFGNKVQKSKSCLILEKEPFQYQQYISDLAGQDIQPHKNDPDQAISIVRDWLNVAPDGRIIPGGKAIAKKYSQFQAELPKICSEAQLALDEITYNDYCRFVYNWLKEEAPGPK